jgi:hypothetical protein
LTTTKFFQAALAVTLAVTLVACSKKPDIKFASAGGPYESKPDFADVESRFPLTPADLNKLTPENLETFTQEEIDQIYARLSAGPMPDGPYAGTFFFSDGGGFKRIAEVAGGIKGLMVQAKLEKLELVGQALWKGKVFYRDQKVLRNMIRDREALKLIVDDPDTLPKTKIQDKDAWLLFPAKLYCGQSLLDGRRESVIIDYAFTDEVEGYREKPDFLAGRRGLKVRDEIRMVRPGFYLGRAYMNRVFVLNFTLYNPEVAKAETGTFLKTGQTQEDCWVGTQSRGATLAKK